LAGRYGLTPLAGYVVALVTVACVNGPCHRIVNPLENTIIPSTFAAVLHGASAFQIGAALSAELEPLRRWIAENIGDPDGQERYRVRLRQSALCEQIRNTEQALAMAGKPLDPLVERMAPPISEREAHVDALNRQAAELNSQLRGSAFGLAPNLIVEGVSLGQLRDPGKLCVDGSVYYAAVRGDFLGMMLRQGTADQRANFVRLLAASWTGVTCAGVEEAHRQPLIGSVVTSTTAGAVELRQKYPEVSHHHLFVGGASGEALRLSESSPEDLTALWRGCLNAVLTKRVERSGIAHSCEPNAARFYGDFVAQVLRRAALSPQPERFERAAILSLKMALLVHLTSAPRESITLDEMEAGCALAWCIVREDFEFATSYHAAPEHRVSSEVERLVAKLRVRGPMTWRELLRGSHRQKAEPLHATLNHAMQLGQVRKENDTYAAT